MATKSRITNVNMQLDEKGVIVAIQVSTHHEVADPENSDAPFMKDENAQCTAALFDDKDKAGCAAFVKLAGEIAKKQRS